MARGGLVLLAFWRIAVACNNTCSYQRAHTQLKALNYLPWIGILEDFKILLIFCGPWYWYFFAPIFGFRLGWGVYYELFVQVWDSRIATRSPHLTGGANQSMINHPPIFVRCWTCLSQRSPRYSYLSSSAISTRYRHVLPDSWSSGPNCVRRCVCQFAASTKEPSFPVDYRFLGRFGQPNDVSV